MNDPREPNSLDFSCTDDAPTNTGYGHNRDEEDLYLDEIILDEEMQED